MPVPADRPDERSRSLPAELDVLVGRQTTPSGVVEAMPVPAEVWAQLTAPRGAAMRRLAQHVGASLVLLQGALLGQQVAFAFWNEATLRRAYLHALDGVP